MLKAISSVIRKCFTKMKALLKRIIGKPRKVIMPKPSHPLTETHTPQSVTLPHLRNSRQPLTTRKISHSDMTTTSDKILKGLQLSDCVLQSYNTSSEGVTTNQLGESKMEAVSINQNDQIITGLREQLEIKDKELIEAKEETDKESKKLKNSNERNRKLKAENEDLKAEIVGLKSDLEKASVVEVTNNSGNEKIQKALFRLDTILMMNGEKESVSLDHLKLVVQDLTGAEQQTNLLLTK